MKKCLYFAVPPGALLNGGTGRSAADISVRDEFAAHFAGFTGTFVMYDPAGDKYIVYNEPQSKNGCPPVPPSKFTTRSSAWKPAYWTRKMYTRCSNGTDAILFPYWNHDHTLASATRESVVWYFQESLPAHRPETDAGIYR